MKKEKVNVLEEFVEFNNQRPINQSLEAPVDGVYRYELIPAENPVDYYVDLWYQFSMGIDRKSTRLNSSHVSESRMPSSA